MSIKTPPTFCIEREVLAQGYERIVGVDEVGCGALAGPVVAGAVILPLDSRIGALRDSKLLNEQRREELYPFIIARATAYAIGSASVEEIFLLGLRTATLLAMRRAVELIDGVDFALVDAWTIPDVAYPQRGIIRGDLKVKSIAAASIIAKVTRDRIMRELSKKYPEYGFGVHKGYGTRDHLDAIKKFGPCEIHRIGYRTFAHTQNI